MQCDYGCLNCYLKKDIADLKEKPKDFFVDLVKVAKSCGMEEIALPINYVETGKEDINLDYYIAMQQVCKEENIKLTMTCNYDFFESYPYIDKSGISLVSISMNDFVTPTKEKRDKCLSTMKRLKEIIPVVNCNILLSKNMVKVLKQGLADEILAVADTMYLLTSKPLNIPIAQYYSWCMELNDDGILVDSPRILLDTCMKYSMGLTGGICDKHKMIYVNPYGEIKMCSFDSKNMAVLASAVDFRDIYSKHFPLPVVESCSLMEGKK
jgi:hypothetical protein